MPIPRGLFGIIKEIARHIIRRPVVGIGAAAQTRDGRWLLVRRTDTGEWALPGGTLEWGETLRTALCREVREEAGADVIELGELVGVYSDPERDARFHAVTVVVQALVDEPKSGPQNPLEIAEARLFSDDELPKKLAFGMSEMLENVRLKRLYWE